MEKCGEAMATDTQKLTIKKSSLLFIFIIAPFFIDQIQGYLTLVLELNIPFSLMFKAGIILFMLAYFIMHRKLYSLGILIFITVVLLLSVFTDVNNLKYIATDLLLFIKLLYFPMAVFFFIAVFKNEKYSDLNLYYIFRFLFYALFVAMIASIFGFGFSQYGVTAANVSIGYSGYFYAGNELAPLAVLLYSYNLFYHLYNKSSILKLSIIMVTGFLTCLLIMTKVSVGGFFVCTLFMPIFMNMFQGVLKWKKITFFY